MLPVAVDPADDASALGRRHPADLARIHCPVLLLYGTESWFLPDGTGYRDGLPDARLVTMPGRHHLPIESAARVSAELAEFLHG